MKELVIDFETHKRKAIPGYEGLYQACSCGQIRSLEKVRMSGKEYKTKRTYPEGYLASSTGGTRDYELVTLRKDSKSKYFTAHSLIALSFLGTRPDGLHINHKNGNHKDNTPKNLEYVSPAENTRHAIRLGLQSIAGENNPKAKLNSQDILEIRAPHKQMTRKELANKYKISVDTIADIQTRRTWKHV